MNAPYSQLPLLAITLGDVAGVGPEVVLRALSQVGPRSFRPLIVGDRKIVDRAAQLVGSALHFTNVEGPEFATSLDPTLVPVWNPATVDFSDEPPVGHTARCGEAAYQWLVAATDAALSGAIDGIVTAPISKAALHLAGHHYPGHTEILAERCGVKEFAMLLHLPRGGTVQGPFGISVAHVTLHTSVASVPGLLSTQHIQETIELLNGFVQRIGCAAPRIGVCALNPHAGEGGLFGDEETRLIRPAVEQAMSQGVVAVGPIPADTLILRAVGGEFDGVVAMYHDQGHIALKLIGFRRAVNITLGLPIVRTSPSHGTAFDIAWQGQAAADGMLEAMKIACVLCQSRTPGNLPTH